MSPFQSITLTLIIAYTLDLILGDPHWLPHPIRWFGSAIAKLELVLNHGKHRKAKGAFMAVVLIAGVCLSLQLFTQALLSHPWLWIGINSMLVFYGLANHTLIAEVLKIERTLQHHGVEAGRKQLSMIVGRDTSSLNAHQIRTAALETLAENLSDGVIAPLFYFALGGAPFMLAYKMVNTLDSMVGYKSDRYKDFGWFAAKFDDLANWIPARITAILMVMVTSSRRAVLFVLKYGKQHASPNAGYPEAALAGILNVRFGGPNTYHGKLLEKPYIGDCDRPLTHHDLRKACWVNLYTSLLAVVLITLAFGLAHC